MGTRAGRRSPWERFWRIPRSVAVACVASAVGGYLNYGVTVVLGAVGTEFGTPADARPGSIPFYLGYSAAALGTVLFLVRIGSLIGVVPTRTADRSGRRRLLLFGYAAAMVASVATAASAALWMFVALQVVARSGLTSTNQLVTTIAAEETDVHARSRAVASVSAAWGVGAGTAAIAYAVLKATPLGWRGLYLGGIVGLVLFPFLVREVTETRRFSSLRRHDRRTLRPLLRVPYRRRLVGVCVLVVLLALQGIPAGAFALAFGERVRGLPSGWIAATVVLAGIPGLGGLFLSGRLSERIGRRPVVAAAASVSAVAAIGLYAGPRPLFAPSFWLFTTAAALGAPAVGTLRAELFPTSSRATAAGVVAAVTVVSEACSLLLFGLLIDRLGTFARAAAVLALAPCLAAGVVFTLPETRDREMEEVSPDPAGAPASR